MNNYYSSNNCSTIGGEFQALTGLYADMSILPKWRSGSNTYPYSLAHTFQNMGYKSVAIYGMKEVGERLYNELKDTETEVKYVIDQNADSIYADVDIYSPDDKLPEVDIIVVTATYYYNSILSNLKDKVSCPIISLDDVINSI